MKLTRREFAKLAGAAGVGAAGLNSLLVQKAFGLTPQLAPMPGNQIPQFVDPLPDLTSGLHVIDATDITLTMREFQSQVLPTGMPPTWVWGYRDDLASPQPATDSYINPVVIATRGTPTKIKFVNNLGFANPAPGEGSQIGAWVQSTDQTLHWADPKMEMGALTNYAGPIPAVPHLHGGEVPPQLDGGPDAWFLSQTATGYNPLGHAYYTRNFKGRVANSAALPTSPTNGDVYFVEDDKTLKKYDAVSTSWDLIPINEAIYRYPNLQEGANIWFHDHALGITRLNVYAGIAGAYIINEPGLWAPVGQPKPPLIPLVIQDRMFDVAGQLFFPNVGINPEHPFWIPEFVGDTIVVNGKVWPFTIVNRQRYTLWFLNGSNARFYDMFLVDRVTGVKGPPMYVITTDGGSLATPVKIDPNATGQQAKAGIGKSLIVGPGERYEVIVDFNDPTWIANLTAAYGGTLPGTVNLHLRNNARTPFPGGAPAPNSTTGRIVEFRVNTAAPGADTTFDPAGLAALRTRPIIRLYDKATFVPATGLPAKTWTVRRQLTLNEAMGPGGPLEVLVNNTKWGGHSIHEAMTHNGVTIDANGVRSDFKDTVNSDGSHTYYSEVPKEGDAELWEIINITADAHPIHLHLVQFQLVSRQAFDANAYIAAYDALFPATNTTLDPMTNLPYAGGVFIGGYGPPLPYGTTGIVGGNPDVTPFLNAKKWPARLPLPSEEGWKDTVIMYPGEVTRILVRWAPTDVAAGVRANFPFDPNAGHGFVWHCHIIDHEDNEMMRPDLVDPIGSATNSGPLPTPRSYLKGVDY